MIRAFLRMAAPAGALLLAATVAEARVSRILGGPFDGLRAEFPDDGPPYFIPGLARESPPSPGLRAKIDTQFEAARKAFAESEPVRSGDKPGVRNPGEKDERFEGRLLTQCRAADIFRFVAPFGTPVSASIPVRVSIVCNGRVTQFVTFEFRDELMVGTRVADAVVPTFVAPAQPG